MARARRYRWLITVAVVGAVVILLGGWSSSPNRYSGHGVSFRLAQGWKHASPAMGTRITADKPRHALWVETFEKEAASPVIFLTGYRLQAPATPVTRVVGISRKRRDLKLITVGGLPAVTFRDVDSDPIDRWTWTYTWSGSNEYRLACQVPPHDSSIASPREAERACDTILDSFKVG